MKCFIITIVYLMTVMVAVNVSLGTDPVKIMNLKVLTQQNELEDSKAGYTKITHKEPTSDNLIKSLRIEFKQKDIQDEQILEVFLTLQILALEKDNMDSDKLTKAIMTSYETNISDPFFRTLCLDALLNINKPKGIDLARKIMDENKLNMDAKLRISTSLVRNKELFGYPVLREGLLIYDDRQRKTQAIPLLKDYFPYDGAVYGEHGEKVDIKALIAEAKKNAKGNANIIIDLENAESEFDKLPKKQDKKEKTVKPANK
jgi:hypothetical protein